jgi:hypothetical protein
VWTVGDDGATEDEGESEINSKLEVSDTRST